LASSDDLVVEDVEGGASGTPENNPLFNLTEVNNVLEHTGIQGTGQDQTEDAGYPAAFHLQPIGGIGLKHNNTIVPILNTGIPWGMGGENGTVHVFSGWNTDGGYCL
jgi:hypothetical protein